MAKPRSRITKVLIRGPLSPLIEDYRRELLNRDYTERTVVNLLRQAGRLSRWLEVNDYGLAELDRHRIEEFLSWQRSDGRNRSQWSRPALLCLLDVLGGLGAMQPEASKCPIDSTEMVLDRFRCYLLTERGLAAGTVNGYVDHARRFLAGLAADSDLATISASEVTDAVLAVSAAVSVPTAQNFVAGLRSFLRFSFIEGLVGFDLSQAALPVTGRRRSSLPRGITDADARALLRSCDRRSSIGRRDYAVLITLLQLGLRRGEVARLRLDDIDWRAGQLVVRGKGARHDRLPLPAAVGQGIASYLRRGRPTSGRREVFLRARAPFAPIDPGTVASTVRRACRRAGIAEVGPHRLRHSVACDMVAAGVPLIDVAQVLRHHSLQTTASYGRVDVERLRAVAAPWPGGTTR